MKVDALKKLIKEAVKEAIKEELSLSSSNKEQRKTVVDNKPTNSLEEALHMTKSSMTNEDYQNVMSFDASDAKNFFSSDRNLNNLQTSSSPAPGLDISNLDFVKKASKVLDASYQKDKAKLNNGV